MKTKITILFAAAFMISTASFAQTSYGAKLGINMANIKESGAGAINNSDAKLGLNLGVFAEVEISDKLSVQPELNFSQLGTKISDNGDSYKFRFNTLAVPVLAKYRIANFALIAGPQLSFVASAKEVLTIAGLGSESSNVKADYKGTDFSAVFGAEYGFADKFVAGARYQAGLSDINKVAEPGYKTTANAFTLSIGYKFK